MEQITKGLSTAAFLDGPDAIPEGVDIIDVRDLQDNGGDEDPTPIVEDIMNALYILEDDNGQVCIRCQHGISRSNAVAAAVLVAAKMFNTYGLAIKYVKSKVPRASPNPGIMKACQAALDQIKQEQLSSEMQEYMSEEYSDWNNGRIIFDYLEQEDNDLGYPSKDD